MISKLVEKPQLFDAEILGASFREIAVDVIRGESTDFVSRWFRASRADADLTIWIDGEKRIVKHQLSFFGQIVEWNAIHGTRTGLIVEEEIAEPGVTATPGSASASATAELRESFEHETEVAETIRFDTRPQPLPVQQAIRLLSFVPELGEEERQMMIFHLRESPKLHKNARERALKAWAPTAEELVSNRRSSFWKRLKNWVLGS